MTSQEIEKEINELTDKLSDPGFLSSRTDAKIAGARLQKLRKIQAVLEKLEKVSHELAESKKLAADPIFADMATEDIARLTAEAEKLKKELNNLENEKVVEILPTDVIIEIRAGAGGTEASLFARELFSMYTRFAESKKWQVELISSSESELGGFKEVVFEVDGEDAYKLLRYESGVHRIQRIPATEKQERIHTSTASVAVLPKVKDIDVEIKPPDIKVEFYRSSGPGGQNVNKVETAVRITHLPTGFVVTSQEGRSQLKNRERAMSILRARIYDIQREAEEKKQAAERRSQIGTADRSEKIRTYNFSQDRITDHRINQNFHNIEQIMEGDLGPIIEACQSMPPGAASLA
ncbi:MAG: peptide chain release factor 1 [Candidatus Sungbacteria bacterium]|uniref:Peptide chain release factor 1 n=1 Tax=Candidatus Sungiibacteriota bacterium TaxID=2750080 RepID=A0A9D6LMM0_9BACT|nr:peptide chain release factor 1 [Candidatus Sungbacteria bacterium]